METARKQKQETYTFKAKRNLLVEIVKLKPGDINPPPSYVSSMI